MKKRLLILVAVLAACETPTVPDRVARDVYRYELLTPTPRVLRWPLGTVVQVFLVEHTDAARTAALRAALTNAVDVWNAAVLYGEVQLRQTNDLADADVLLSLSSTTLPVSVSHCTPGGSAAFTTFCLSEDGKHLAVFPATSGAEGHVKFLVTVRDIAPLDPNSVMQLVAHELGHVLGLAQHSPLSTDLMHRDAAIAARPTARDRATLQALYHTKAEITP